MGQQTECKLDHVVERYSIDDPLHPSVDAGLLARWRGEDGHASQGYRTLTTWFNQRVLRTVYERNGRKTLGNRVESDYEALTGNDELLRGEVQSDLRTDGINVVELTDQFVSWGTVRTHLTDCLDGEKPSETATTDWQLDTVKKARAFAASKTESTLGSLANSGDLAGADDAKVDVQIKLRCEECPTAVPFESALRRGYVCETHHTELAEGRPDQR